MLAGADRARPLPAVRQRRRHGQPVGVEGIGHAYVEQVRIAGGAVQPDAHRHAIGLLLDRLPGAPAQQAVDRVVVLGLAQVELELLAGELVGAVLQSVGPRDERGSARAVAHGVFGIGVEYIAVAVRVGAHAAADLDDDRPLVTRGDLELPTGRQDGHRPATRRARRR